MFPVSVRVAGVSLLIVILSTGWMRSQIVPALPVIPANSFNITNFGAIGDAVTTNTTAIQNTINAASMAGGGTVEIPASGTPFAVPLTCPPTASTCNWTAAQCCKCCLSDHIPAARHLRISSRRPRAHTTWKSAAPGRLTARATGGGR